jgi:hypothetical protein
MGRIPVGSLLGADDQGAGSHVAQALALGRHQHGDERHGVGVWLEVPAGATGPAGKQPCRSSDLAAGPGSLWVAAPAGLYRVDLERLG